MDDFMIYGIVKWFNDSRGYGFIESEGQEYFLHFSQIQKDGYKSARPGEKVCFEPSKSEKGLIANSVVFQ